MYLFERAALSLALVIPAAEEALIAGNIALLKKL
jgi:hypothetical protein